jgi:DNA-binding protein HU-beta
VPLTQTQLASAVADRAELSKTDAKRALAALEEIVLEQLGNAEKVRIGGMVQLTVRVRPAQRKRQGRNPATGERSRSRPSRQAWTCVPGRWRKRRQRCRRCGKHAGASPRNSGFPFETPRYQTLDALPREIAELRTKGYQLVTLT